jgi:magnesium-dependent phosphatase 1
MRIKSCSNKLLLLSSVYISKVVGFSSISKTTSAASAASMPQTMPKMIVFDLDDCLWSPEVNTEPLTRTPPLSHITNTPSLTPPHDPISSQMYTLPNKPINPILGRLQGDAGEGVIGVQCSGGGPTVSLFPDALATLQRLHTERDTTFKDTLFAVASSSEEPSYSRSCLENLDIFPGIKMNSLFPYQQIGRTGKLTSRKTTHFDELKKQVPHVKFDSMLFFDDCNWGDHVGDLNSARGVIGIRTPTGLTNAQFEEGLALYARTKS